MKKSRFIVAVFLYLLSFNIFASLNNVTGAFGLKFGEIVPKETNCHLTKKHTTDDCSLIPPKPFVSFKSYRVGVARINSTYRIYEIHGYKNMGKNYPKCSIEAELIASKIESKYKIKLSRAAVKLYPLVAPTKPNGESWSIADKNNNKKIYVSCYKINPSFTDDENSYYQLYILYQNSSDRKSVV